MGKFDYLYKGRNKQTAMQELQKRPLKGGKITYIGNPWDPQKAERAIEARKAALKADGTLPSIHPLVLNNQQYVKQTDLQPGITIARPVGTPPVDPAILAMYLGAGGKTAPADPAILAMYLAAVTPGKGKTAPAGKPDTPKTNAPGAGEESAPYIDPEEKPSEFINAGTNAPRGEILPKDHQPPEPEPEPEPYIGNPWDPQKAERAIEARKAALKADWTLPSIHPLVLNNQQKAERAIEARKAALKADWTLPSIHPLVLNNQQYVKQTDLQPGITIGRPVGTPPAGKPGTPKTNAPGAGEESAPNPPKTPAGKPDTPTTNAPGAGEESAPPPPETPAGNSLIDQYLPTALKYAPQAAAGMAGFGGIYALLSMLPGAKRRRVLNVLASLVGGAGIAYGTNEYLKGRNGTLA